MKNKLLLSSIIFALSILPVISSAEEGSASLKIRVGTSTEARIKAKAELEVRRKEMEERRETLKNEMEEKRETLKDEMEQKRETIKGEIENKRESIKDEVEKRRENAIENIQNRLNKFVHNVTERFDAAIERLEKLASRIDGRITKMEAENIDVTNAKELMVVAKIKIETAKTSIAGLSLESEVISSSTATTTVDIKEDFQNLKNQVEKAKKDIKAAHAALVEVIRNLKPGQHKTATSTNATSTRESEND